jgi:thioredoxin-related protein
MKNIFSLLIIITALSCNNKSRKNFYELTIQEAKKHHKIILLDFSATWCGGCKAYDKYVFSDSSIKSKLTENYILLKIDKDLPDNKFLIEKYKIGGLPHIVIIDSKERILGSISGFYSKYVEKPDLFLTDLKVILDLQENIKQLESLFNADTTNIESITSLLSAYQTINQYRETEKLENLLVRLSPSPERLFEYNYTRAIHIIQNDLDVEPLLSFIQENPNMDYNHKWGAFSQLLYHYRDNEDIRNQDKYYLILLKLDPDYFKHHYIEFLFENKLKVDTAITLTNEYIADEKYRNTFWGHYLLAHKLAYLGKVSQAVQSYSKWMEDNNHEWETGNSYWSLYFYAKFANYYNIDLERALIYIQIAEKNRNMPEEKVLMAEILKKLGRVNESIVKLNEAIDLVDSQNDYKRITKLIDDYKKK